MKILCFDTETTGFPKKDEVLSKMPYIVQRGQTCFDTDTFKSDDDFYGKIDQLFNPNYTKIPKVCTDIHGISDEMVKDAPLFFGFLEDTVIPLFESVDLIVAHNAQFDMNMLYIEAMRAGKKYADKVASFKPKVFCTMKTTTNICKVPGPMGFKRPKLQELHKHCFGEMFEDAHNAFADVEATGKCFVHLLNQGVFKIVDGSVQVFIP